MGTPTEQFDIGSELETIVRETVSSVITVAFNKSDETYLMCSRLDAKLNNLDALFKTDSDRLAELSRLDKQVERISAHNVENRSKMESFMACIDSLTTRITYLDG